jgi:thioredoxin 1
LERGNPPSTLHGMSLHAVTQSNFTAEVLESSKPVLVDFTAAWCPPCRAMNPILDQMAAERDDIKIVSVDVDNEQELASQWGVMGMPTFLLFHNGRLLHERLLEL